MYRSDPGQEYSSHLYGRGLRLFGFILELEILWLAQPSREQRWPVRAYQGRPGRVRAGKELSGPGRDSQSSIGPGRTRQI
jgi:hypothetical protein